jgi:glycosyltransferase involved in cell wall biosynthesis
VQRSLFGRDHVNVSDDRSVRTSRENNPHMFEMMRSGWTQSAPVFGRSVTMLTSPGSRGRQAPTTPDRDGNVTELSIITINRNNAHGLAKTLASVADQTERDFEYLVVDGASSDGSLGLIAEATEVDWWVSEPDSGIYEAMNKGIVNAAGEYLLFLNSGDVLYEADTVEKVRSHLGSADIVYGDLRFETPDHSWDAHMPEKVGLRHMMLDTLYHPVSFIKRDLFDRHGVYDPSYEICGDYEWFFNVIVDKGVTLRHIDQIITVYEFSGVSSDPGNLTKITQERMRAQTTWLSQRQLNAFRRRERLRGIARHLAGPVRRPIARMARKFPG